MAARVQPRAPPGPLRAGPQGLVASTFSALGARVATVASQIVVLGLIAGAYGPSALDEYVVLFTVAQFSAYAIDFGTGLWATREVAGGNAMPLFLTTRLPIVAVLLAALVVTTALTDLGVLEAVSTAAIALAVAWSVTVRGVLWGKLEYGREAAVAAAEALLLVALLVALPVAAGVRAEPIALAAVALGSGALARVRLLPRDVLAPDRAPLVGWFRQVRSFGLHGFVATASAQFDILLLALLGPGLSPGEVGAYGIALRVYYAAPMPLESLGAASMPRFVAAGRERVLQVARLGAAGTALAVAGAVAFGFASPLLGFDGEVVDALRPVLWVLLISLPLRCVSYLTGAWVTARGGQTQRFLAALAALVTMVALDLLLIPAHGAMGAAWALVASDAVLFVGFLIAARTRMDVD